MTEKIILAFQNGGLWMWAILFFQIVSIIIIAERSRFLFFKRKEKQKDYGESFSQNLRQGNVETVIQKAEKDLNSQPLAQAVIAGAEAALNCGGKEEIQSKMDEALMTEMTALDKRTGFLMMLGNVGTLTGLLGTIIGMIKAFSAVTYTNPAEKATLLSSGISEAMNTTAYGLIMAIPALFMFAVLQNRSNALREDLAQGAVKVFNLLSYHYQKIGEKKLGIQNRG